MAQRQPFWIFYIGCVDDECLLAKLEVCILLSACHCMNVLDLKLDKRQKEHTAPWQSGNDPHLRIKLTLEKLNKNSPVLQTLIILVAGACMYVILLQANTSQTNENITQSHPTWSTRQACSGSRFIGERTGVARFTSNCSKITAKTSTNSLCHLMTFGNLL